MNIRPAILEDANSITELNYKYYKAYLDKKTDKGFLKNNFSKKEIEQLINANEIVVSTISDHVIGYYLVNSIHQSQTVLNREKIISEMIIQKVLPIGRYVYLTQSVVDEKYMQKGIAKELLVHLKILIKERFDYLIGYIDNENLNAKEAHLRSGWEIITKFENGYLAITKA